MRCTRASACMGTVVLALHSGVLPAPLPPQGRPKAAQRQSGHAAAPNTLGGTEGEPNGRNFRPPGVAFLEGSAVLHGPLLRGGCFARRSQATSCGACCRYASQAWALGAGPTGPMGERAPPVPYATDAIAREHHGRVLDTKAPACRVARRPGFRPRGHCRAREPMCSAVATRASCRVGLRTPAVLRLCLLPAVLRGVQLLCMSCVATLVWMGTAQHPADRPVHICVAGVPRDAQRCEAIQGRHSQDDGHEGTLCQLRQGCPRHGSVRKRIGLVLGKAPLEPGFGIMCGAHVRAHMRSGPCPLQAGTCMPRRGFTGPHTREEAGLVARVGPLPPWGSVATSPWAAPGGARGQNKKLVRRRATPEIVGAGARRTQAYQLPRSSSSRGSSRG